MCTCSSTDPARLTTLRVLLICRLISRPAVLRMVASGFFAHSEGLLTPIPKSTALMLVYLIEYMTRCVRTGMQQALPNPVDGVRGTDLRVVQLASAADRNFVGSMVRCHHGTD